MRNRWNDAEAGTTPLEQLVHMSRIMGEDEGLVLWGGGNTSVKTDGVDLLGRPIRLMLIKGSGSNMKAVGPRDFPGLRLNEIRASMDHETMSDDEMVAYLARCMVDPTAPRPSIETLLHGYLEAPAVAHSHADAILSLTNTAGGRATVRRAFGDSVAVIGYRRPGFTLAKEVHLAVRNAAVTGVVLMNHGLITWGNTPREAYEQHIALVSKAEDFINSAKRQTAATSRTHRDIPTATRRQTAARVAPAIRGALSAQGRKILTFDDSADILEFLDSPRARDLAEIGPATPDHLLNTKRHPLFVDVPHPADAPEVTEAVKREVARYVHRYVDFYERHQTGEALLDPVPCVVLVRGLGMWTAGRDIRSSVIPSDIYHHTISVMGGAEAVDRYASLSEKDAFEAEYWPLELYKLTLAPPERELSRRIALVTGAARGIGAAIARRLAAEGAHVIVTDVHETGAQAVASAIRAANGEGCAVGARLDVTDEESVATAFELARLTYGGLDVLVSNAGIAHVAPIDTLSLAAWEQSLAVNATGHFLVGREAMRLFKEQGLGGAMVFVATKNVPAPGRNFGAYSAAKAAEAQLARVLAIEGGQHGIRVNMVNPDAVFEDSGLWSEELRHQRASVYGIGSHDLEDFYRQRNLLRARVTPDDVAEAVLWLASDRSAKTTGAMIPVDGGVREAFPR